MMMRSFKRNFLSDFGVILPVSDTASLRYIFRWQAINHARLNLSTISYFYVPETPISRWDRVGKGATTDAKARKLAFQHWIETVRERAVDQPYTGSCYSYAGRTLEMADALISQIVPDPSFDNNASSISVLYFLEINVVGKFRSKS
ncbi:hypothetical protein C5167_004156 [Papaver somniferum]|nr:hypothetical protein C5167_004156 [Papaver somniferum]